MNYFYDLELEIFFLLLFKKIIMTSRPPLKNNPCCCPEEVIKHVYRIVDNDTVPDKSGMAILRIVHDGAKDGWVENTFLYFCIGIGW